MFYGDIESWFQKMMILVALFSWAAVGWCILFNMGQIMPFKIITTTMVVTYFQKLVITAAITMTVAYLMAVRTPWNW